LKKAGYQYDKFEYDKLGTAAAAFFYKYKKAG
jgi:hypothetical protein